MNDYTKKLKDFLDAVVQGYTVRSFEDRFATVDTPGWTLDSSKDPKIVLDMVEVKKFLDEKSREREIDLKSLMHGVPQVVYALRVHNRTILISSVTSFSVFPDTLMASIMTTEKNAIILGEPNQNFILWALSKGAMRRFKTGKFDGSGFISSDEYMWKAKGKTLPLQKYLDHTILMLGDLSFERGLGHNHLIWKNGTVE